MPKGIAIALAAGLTAGLLAAGALADQGPRVASSLTLRNPEATSYEGVVRSSKRACKKRRKVTVVHDLNRNGADRSDYVIGTDRSDKKGRYEVEGNQAPLGDSIAASVGRRKLPSGTVCLGATVSAIAIPG
jgi:hypothetical protein